MATWTRRWLPCAAAQLVLRHMHYTSLTHHTVQLKPFDAAAHKAKPSMVVNVPAAVSVKSSLHSKPNLPKLVIPGVQAAAALNTPPPFTPPAKFVLPGTAYLALVDYVARAALQVGAVVDVAELNARTSAALVEQHHHSAFLLAVTCYGWRAGAFAELPHMAQLLASLQSLAVKFIPGFVMYDEQSFV